MNNTGGGGEGFEPYTIWLCILTLNYRAFSRDITLSSSMAASMATAINIHLCTSFYIIVHNGFSINFSIHGSSAWWSRTRFPGYPGQSAQSDGHFGGQHDVSKHTSTYHQLRARKALSIFKDPPLRTRRALLLYKVEGDSALLVLNETSLNSDSALLALNWQYMYMQWLQTKILLCLLLLKGSFQNWYKGNELEWSRVNWAIKKSFC